MIVIQAPLRLSLVGGGSDLESFYKRETGAVISCTIDKYVYVILKERYDNKIYVTYSQKEVVDVSQRESIKHDLVRESLYLVPDTGGIEITFLADIPSSGSGLGSSSSITVGLLKALHELTGTQVSGKTLAREACVVEIQRLGKPIGKQDQYAAALGGMKVLKFYPWDSVGIENVRVGIDTLRKLSSRMLLFFTNFTRKADNILSEQMKNTEEKRAVLRQMVALVPNVRSAIEEQRFDEVGELLHENWLLKRSLASQISNDGIDEMYTRARRAGAIGGKIAGAGGGGFLMLYVPRDRQEGVRKALNDFTELPFSFEVGGCRVIYSEDRKLDFLPHANGR